MDERAPSPLEEADLKIAGDSVQLLFDEHPSPMWIYDIDSLQFMSVNQAAVDQYGYSREEFLSMTIEEIRPGEDVDRLREYLGMLNSRSTPTVWRHRRKNGELFDVEVTGTGLKIGDRRARLVVINDVTERTNAIRQLRTSEIRFRRMVERSYEAVALISPDFIVQYTSPSAHNILGFEDHELIGRSIFEFIHPSDAGAVTKELAELFRENGRARSVEFRARHRDGQMIWMEGRGQNLLEVEGVEAIVVNFRVIEERKHFEEVRRIYADVVEQVQIGVAVWRLEDPQDRTSLCLVMLNKAGADSMQRDRGEVVGKMLRDFRPLAMDSAVSRALAEIALNGGSREILDASGIEDPDHIYETHIFGLPDRCVGIVFEDVTARRAAEYALRRSEERFRSIVETTTEWIWEVDLKGNLTYSNPTVEQMLGYTPEEVIGQNSFDLMPPEYGTRAIDQFRALVEQKSGWSGLVFRVRNKNGTYRYLESNGVPAFDESGTMIGFRGADRDITERRRAEELMRHQAYHDALTGLPNRMLFNDRLTMALAHASRNRELLAVMFLDLDDFKVINDTLGHRVGDDLLESVAQRLKSTLRIEDSIARVGGDEFTLLLPGIGDAQSAEEKARKILTAVAAPFEIDGRQLFVTTSIGIALFPTHGDDAESLLKNADNAMYRAKESGRNTFRLYDDQMQRRTLHRLAMESMLRQALERDEFFLHYQPIYDRVGEQIVAVEALLRWKHPERGMIPPDEFIPVAEETRMILPVGAWVLNAACRQMREWIDAGIAPQRMCVNLSAYQLARPEFVADLVAALHRFQLDPDVIELEVTESVAMINAESTMRTLKEIKTIGVNVAIDDFGTGQTSLVYLTRFPVDTVKIDRTFVHDVITDAADAVVVSAVIALARSLKLRVIAEGVETAEQHAFLRERMCEGMQGFYFSRPIAPEVLERLLRERRVDSKSTPSHLAFRYSRSVRNPSHEQDRPPPRPWGRTISPPSNGPLQRVVRSYLSISGVMAISTRSVPRITVSLASTPARSSVRMR